MVFLEDKPNHKTPAQALALDYLMVFLEDRLSHHHNLQEVDQLEYLIVFSEADLNPINHLNLISQLNLMDNKIKVQVENSHNHLLLVVKDNLELNFVEEHH